MIKCEKMAKIKVLYILPSLAAGGAERATADLARHIDKDRFDVSICVYGSRTESFIERDLFSSGIKVRYVNRRYSKNPFYNSAFYFYSLVIIERIIRDIAPDVIDFRISSMSYIVAVSLLFFKRVSLVYDIQSMPEKELSRSNARLLKACINNFGVMPVVLSDRFAPILNDICGTKRCEVIPNGIDLDDFKVPFHIEREAFSRSGDIIMVYVAYFRSGKNHQFLIRSFAEILKLHPKTVLLLAGDGELIEDSKALARDLGIDRSVKFLGRRDDVHSILSISDIFVIPSEWEGAPISILEAMASGLPVVASSVGGIVDMVKHGLTGFLFPVNDQRAFFESVSSLINDPKIRREMGDRAKEAAKGYDMITVADKFARLYSREVNKRLELSC